MACALVVQAVAVAEFGPLGAGADGDVAGRQIDDGGRNEKRRDAARTVLEQVLCSRSMTSNPPMPLPM